MKLAFDETLNYYRGKVRAEARSLNCTAQLTASLEELRDTAQVKVTRKEQGPSLDFRLVPESYGPWRAIHEKEISDSGQEQMVIKIFGHHPAMKHVLGENFEGQESPLCRAIMAEILAAEAARIVVDELYRMRRTTEEFSSDRLYLEHYKRMTRFLPLCQRILVGINDLTAQSPSGPPQ